MIGRGVCRAGAAIRWDWLSLVWPLWGQGARVWDRARLARILGFRRDIGGGVGWDGGGQLQKALTQQEVGLEWRFREDALRPGRLFPARSDSRTDEAES